jgi:hypothetical protein
MALIEKFTRASPHLKIALVVAPLLLVGGYILAGFYQPGPTTETPPASARTGSALEVPQGCHLPGGVCELLHREIALNLSATPEGNSTLIYLAASVPLEGVLVAGGEHSPTSMVNRGTPKRWKATLPYLLQRGDSLRLAVVSGERRYFAEIPIRP